MTATTLDGVLLKGVAASRPAASAVAKGTLYSATDTGAITQSDGVSTWSAYATITQGNLTGDVTSVGLATTIGAGKVTEAMQVLADNTTANVSTTKHGYAPKAPNDATKFLDGTGAYTVPAGAGAAGALVFLEAHTASSSATLDFTSWYSATYDDYLIELVGLLPASNAVELKLVFSTDGGSTWDTTSGHYRWSNAYAGTAADTGGQGSASAAYIRPLDSASTTGGVGGSVKLQGPGQTAFYVRTLHHIAFHHSSGADYSGVGQGAYTQATAINGFRFSFSSGNIASGIIRVYGVTKS